MKRRSFLGFLLAAPVAAPVLAKAAMSAQENAPAAPLDVAELSAYSADVGELTSGSISSADGGMIIDFGHGRIVMRSDLYTDGSITAV